LFPGDQSSLVGQGNPKRLILFKISPDYIFAVNLLASQVVLENLFHQVTHLLRFRLLFKIHVKTKKYFILLLNLLILTGQALLFQQALQWGQGDPSLINNFSIAFNTKIYFIPFLEDHALLAFRVVPQLLDFRCLLCHLFHLMLQVDRADQANP
jgi:hypothetical protein